MRRRQSKFLASGLLIAEYVAVADGNTNFCVRVIRDAAAVLFSFRPLAKLYSVLF
jgi:hypothetical protein